MIESSRPSPTPTSCATPGPHLDRLSWPGGETYAQAVLKATEAVTLGCWCSVLGGSGEQALRLLNYLNPNVSPTDSLWNEERAPNAPRWLLPRVTAVRKIRLRNGGTIEAQMASTKSARGGHPSRLGIDEVDEVNRRALKAAMGHTMRQPSRLLNGEIISPCTLLSSTRQYPDGTMQWALQQGGKKGWHITEWTYRDTLRVEGKPENENGWLDQADVDEMRSKMTSEQWEAEAENQEPNPAGRAINPEIVKRLFRRSWSESEAELGEWVMAELRPRWALRGRCRLGAQARQDRDRGLSHRREALPLGLPVQAVQDLVAGRCSRPTTARVRPTRWERAPATTAPPWEATWSRPISRRRRPRPWS